MPRQLKIQHNATELRLSNSTVPTRDDVRQILAASCLTSLRANAHYSSKEAVTQLLTLPLLKLYLEGYDPVLALTCQSTLTELTLDLCDIQTEALDAVVRNNPLREINITLSEGLTSLQTLSEKSTLTSVVISDSDFTLRTSSKLEEVRLLCLNSNITNLALTHNGLTDETAIVLSRNTNLVSLSLSYNKITSKGVTALLSNPSIEELYVTDCVIDGLIPFDSNTTLQRLMIDPYPLSIRDVRALAANTTLTHLTANIDDDGCKVLETNNTSLISLYTTRLFDSRVYHQVERNLERKLNHTAMLMTFCILVRRAYSR